MQALLRLLWESKVVFISHRWTRPPVRDEAGEVLEPGSPDDDNNTKYRLICKGVEALMKQLHWKKHQTYLWMDFCCVKQVWELDRAQARGLLVHWFVASERALGANRSFFS